MPAEPIRYYDRYTRTVKTERIYGEGWLRFAYENPAGRFFVWLLARRALFSHWYGWKMRKRVSGLQILPFIVEYDINVDEFLKSPFDFKTFNDFFYRQLKPGARPIALSAGFVIEEGLAMADVRRVAASMARAATGW